MKDKTEPKQTYLKCDKLNILLKKGRQQTALGRISTGSVLKSAALVQIRTEVVCCLSFFFLREKIV